MATDDISSIRHVEKYCEVLIGWAMVRKLQDSGME